MISRLQAALSLALLMIAAVQANSQERAPAKPDFSTPKAAVQTFVAASQARDADLLSKCFHAKAVREFEQLVKKSASKEQLDGLAELFKGAEITGVEEKGDEAVVKVKLKPRSESISLGKSAGGWKIIDF